MTMHRRISRRTFLASSLAGAAAIGWGAASRAQDPQPDRWVLLADIHIPGDRNKADGTPPVKPVEKFAAMRAEVLALDYKPAGILVAGDCVYLHGQREDYVTLKEESQPFVDAGIPLHFFACLFFPASQTPAFERGRAVAPRTGPRNAGRRLGSL